MSVPPALKFLTDCAQTGRYTTWTKFQHSPVNVRINDKTFRNYTISTKSYYDNAIVLPSDCSQQESFVLHRLGANAPGYDQFATQLGSDDENEDDYDNYESLYDTYDII